MGSRRGLDLTYRWAEDYSVQADRSPLVRRIWTLQGTAVLLAGAATVLISVLSALSFGYRDENLRVEVGTAAALIAALAAFLLYDRYRGSRRIDSLALFLALFALAVADLLRIVGPSPAAVDPDPVSVWLPLWVQVFASILLAAAAFAPGRPIPAAGRGRATILLALAGLAAAGIGALVLGPHLAVGIDPQVSPAASGSPRLAGSPGLLGAQLVVMALAFTASLGFTARAGRDNDELLAWFALAATISGFSRLNYFLFPSIYTGWVYTGDFLRVIAYLLILVGVMRQIALFQRRARQAAVLEERGRIARDLHDSLGQDLAFIAMRASSLAGDDPRIRQINQAAEQALSSSRGVISSLSREGEPLVVAVERLATRLCERAGVPLRLEVGDGVTAADERREVLLRILAEAIGNSLHHADPSLISVELSGNHSALRLTVVDDGEGFDEEGSATGLGLAGMNERVEAAGGELSLDTAPGRGTRIEVRL
jgi:signal transduction histidine kinase